MKLLNCEKNQGTFIASTETLIPLLQSLMNATSIEIYKIQKCDMGGWHIFYDINKKEEEK